MQCYCIIVGTSDVIDVATMVMLLANVRLPVMLNAIIAITLATIHENVQTDNVTGVGFGTYMAKDCSGGEVNEDYYCNLYIIWIFIVEHTNTC